jgi:hypothetical protein
MAPSPASPLQGSCLCGAVRYEITEPFQRAGYCHCSRCRKLTGAPAALNGRLRREGFRLLSGQERLGIYLPPRSQLPAIFCKTCGSTLFRGEWPDGDVIGIRIGTLDGDPGIEPQFHMFIDSRGPSDNLPEDGLPRFSERVPNGFGLD